MRNWQRIISRLPFEKKSGLTDQLQLYGNDESNGPDMYLYAHDSLGTFAEMGILAPITDVISEDVMADLLPMTVEAGNYKDTQYLMPVYYETLLFMYNKANGKVMCRKQQMNCMIIW